MEDHSLTLDGFCLLERAIPDGLVGRLQTVCFETLNRESPGVQTRSSRGHVFAARNLIGAIPEVSTIWRNEPLHTFLTSTLGESFGLVRALYFDKPPGRTWSLAWHKDTSIAVKDNSLASPSFSKPTVKAGVPHTIASDPILEQMLTLRIHLDDVTEDNGPLRVIPGSHLSSIAGGPDATDPVSIHAAAGDVLAMRPLLSHSSGSSKPGSTRQRRVLHLEFAPGESLPDGYRWHDFVSANQIPNRA